MNLNDLFNEEKVRLDPACWHNKKIGNPKTKMKGGTRVNNCVPKESIEEQSNAPSTANSVNTSGVKDFTKKALGKVGRNVMPALGFTDAAERLSNKDYTGAGISAAAGAVGLVPAWPAQVASGGLELVNMARDEANELGGYDKLAAKISKNFTPASDPSYLPEDPTQSEGVVSTGKALYNRGKDFVKYLGRDVPVSSGPDTTSTVDLGKKGLPGSDKRWAYQSSEPGAMKVKPFGEPGGEPVAPPAVMRGRDNPKFDPNLSKTDPRKTMAQREQEAADLLAKMAKLKVQQGKPKINAKDYEAHLAKQKELQQQLKDLRTADVEPPTLLPSKSPNPAAAQTADSNQVPTIKLPNGQTIPDPARVSPSGQYSTQSGSSPEFEKIKQKWDQEYTPVPSKGQYPWGGEIKDRPSWAPQRKPSKPSMMSKFLGGDLDEASRKKPKEVDYHAIDHDKSVARLRHLAGIGPMKTVWDPEKRVYKNVPAADQLQKK